MRRRLATVLYCCNFFSAKAKVKECYGSLDLWVPDEKADDVPQAAGSAGFRTPLTWIWSLTFWILKPHRGPDNLPPHLDTLKLSI